MPRKPAPKIMQGTGPTDSPRAAWGCSSGARFSLTGTKLELKAVGTTLPTAKHPLGTFSTKQNCSIFIPWRWKVCRPSCPGDSVAANS